MECKKCAELKIENERLEDCLRVAKEDISKQAEELNRLRAIRCWRAGKTLGVCRGETENG